MNLVSFRDVTGLWQEKKKLEQLEKEQAKWKEKKRDPSNKLTDEEKEKLRPGVSNARLCNIAQAHSGTHVESVLGRLIVCLCFSSVLIANCRERVRMRPHMVHDAGPGMMRVTDRPFDPSIEPSEYPNWETAQEWSDAHEKLREEIEAMGVVNDTAAELEDLQGELDELLRDIPELERETKNHGAVVEEFKQKWLDGVDGKMGLRDVVDSLHNYFSDTFSKLGSVGQVKLLEVKDDNGADNFAKYGLQILVKFRHHQELRVGSHVLTTSELRMRQLRTRGMNSSTLFTPPSLWMNVLRRIRIRRLQTSCQHLHTRK